MILPFELFDKDSIRLRNVYSTFGNSFLNQANKGKWSDSSRIYMLKYVTKGNNSVTHGNLIR